jgi:hypothetical protein
MITLSMYAATCGNYVFSRCFMAQGHRHLPYAAACGSACVVLLLLLCVQTWWSLHTCTISKSVMAQNMPNCCSLDFFNTACLARCICTYSSQILVELADLQDQEVGDGTTSVVILAAELLKRANDLVRAKIHPTSIIAGYRLAMREVRAS